MTKRTALFAFAVVAVLGTVACGSDQSPTAPRVEYARLETTPDIGFVQAYSETSKAKGK